MTKRSKIILGLVFGGGVILLGLASVGPIMSLVGTPDYTVVESFRDNIELRQYSPMIVAQVEIPGNPDDALSKGFPILAEYIFGKNQGSKEMEMTAPVRQTDITEIAMMAPVRQATDEDLTLIEFIMPSQYTMQTIPWPLDDEIRLIEYPEYQAIVIRFSGRRTEDNLKKHKALLDQFVNESGLEVSDFAVYSYYNPPWTLPFLRRNEISYEVVATIE